MPLLEDVIEIAPPSGPVRATVTVPGSKSLTNRALLIAALAAGRSVPDRRAGERRHPLHGGGAPRARHRG